MTYWRNLGTGAALAECAQESGWTRDAAELEAKLARLPPAQPCFECPSHDASGKLRVIAPQLGRLEFDSGVADAALFECALCGAKWGERLDQVGPGRRGRDFGFRARLDDREAHGTPRARSRSTARSQGSIRMAFAGVWRVAGSKFWSQSLYTSSREHPRNRAAAATPTRASFSHGPSADSNRGPPIGPQFLVPAGNGCDPGAGDSSSARILPRACEVWTLFSTSDDLG